MVTSTRNLKKHGLTVNITLAGNTHLWAEYVWRRTQSKEVEAVAEQGWRRLGEAFPFFPLLSAHKSVRAHFQDFVRLWDKELAGALEVNHAAFFLLALPLCTVGHRSSPSSVYSSSALHF